MPHWRLFAILNGKRQRGIYLRYQPYMDRELEILKHDVRSDDWETCKRAVMRLAEMNSIESTNILLDLLGSEEVQVRNLAATGMRATRDQKFLEPLMKRIKQLGSKGQIGSLVYALEHLDCSGHLYDIANLNLKAGRNVEVKHSTTVILNEQIFILTRAELNQLNGLLDKFDFTIDGFDVKYEIKE